jgi:hypothetical protein
VSLPSRGDATPPLWKIDGRRALAELPPARLSVDLADPVVGVALELTGAEQWSRVAVLGVRLPGHAPGSDTALADAWCRGGDLVATYAQTPERPLRVQVYWQIVPAAPGSILTLDCLVSVQTDLLDAASRLAVESRLPHGEALWAAEGHPRRFLPSSRSLAVLSRASGPGCLLLRPSAASTVSYAEMIHPDDFTADDLAQSDGGLRLTHRLFGGELEKGVILRARLRGVLLPRAGDEPAARAAYKHFLGAPLPLTV